MSIKRVPLSSALTDNFFHYVQGEVENFAELAYSFISCF